MLKTKPNLSTFAENQSKKDIHFASKAIYTHQF